MSTTDAFLRSIFDTRFSSQVSSDPALNAFANTLADNNLYKVAASPLLSARMDNSTWSPGTTLGVSAAQAFLGAALQGLGQKWEADQFQKASELLPQMYNDPDSVVMPEDMSPAAFEKMRFAASRQKIERDAERESMAQKLFGEIAKKRAEAAFDLETKPELAAATAKATRKAELQALAEVDPNSPDLPQNKAAKAGADSLDALRKEFNALEPVKKFAVAKPAADAMSGALGDINAMSDLELTRYAILMIEPGMAVREGEQAAVVNSQNIPDALKGQVLKALKNESQLGAQARDGLRRLAMRAYGSHKDQYEKALSYYNGLAAGRNLLKQGESLSFLGEAPDAEKVFPELPESVSAAAASEAIPSIPPGMKLQRSRVTGETRLVPK